MPITQALNGCRPRRWFRKGAGSVSKTPILEWFFTLSTIKALPVQAYRLPDTGITRCCFDNKEVICPQSSKDFYGENVVVNKFILTIGGSHSFWNAHIDDLISWILEFIKVKNASRTASAVKSDSISTIESALVVSTFAINDGAESTASTLVTLNNTVTGSTPTHYMASQSSTFTGAVWQGYSPAPSFTLSSGSGTKTIYFKVKNASRTASAVKSDSITVVAAIP